MASSRDKTVAPPKLWGGRFSEATDPTVERFSASVHYDKALARHDIRGSIAHVRMLARAGIIPQCLAGKKLKKVDRRFAREG